jgi:hypothetical protein
MPTDQYPYDFVPFCHSPAHLERGHPERGEVPASAEVLASPQHQRANFRVLLQCPQGIYERRYEA